MKKREKIVSFDKIKTIGDEELSDIEAQDMLAGLQKEMDAFNLSMKNRVLN